MTGSRGDSYAPDNQPTDEQQEEARQPDVPQEYDSGTGINARNLSLRSFRARQCNSAAHWPLSIKELKTMDDYEELTMEVMEFDRKDVIVKSGSPIHFPIDES